MDESVGGLSPSKYGLPSSRKKCTIDHYTWSSFENSQEDLIWVRVLTPLATGERESRSPESFAFGILHRERANKVFGKRPMRLLNDLRNGSSSVQVWCCGVSSLATSSAALCSYDHRRPVCTVRLPEGKSSVRTLLFNSVFNHVFWDHDSSAFCASCY